MPSEKLQTRTKLREPWEATLRMDDENILDAVAY